MKTRTMILAGAAWIAASVATNNFTSIVLGLPVLFTAPVTEEVWRAGVAEKLAPRATRIEAAVIGAVGGLLELIWKVLTMPMSEAAAMHPAYFFSFVTSLPIHIALSIAFYSHGRRAVLKNIGLHALFNATLYGLGSYLIAKASPQVYSALMVGVALALCAVILMATERASLQPKET